MPALSYIKLSNKLACQATPTVYGVLHPDEIDAANDVQAVEDQESLTVRFSRLDLTGTVRAITAQMRAGRVLTVVWDDGTFEEWRVGVVTTGRGEKGLITVSCVPLWLDLVERADSSTGKGWVSDLSAGARNFEYELTQRTPTSILSTYVIPACPTWVTLGTVDPTYVIPSLSVSRLTPGALTLAVRDTLRAVDVTCEVRLRRNGSTNYLLDLVTQVGASGNTPVFHPSTSLLSLTQKTDPTLQATRVLAKGTNTPDGLPGVWGVSRWKAGAPAGNVIALTDRNGGASPIAFDGQFVGMFLLRVKTGATFAITASAAAAGTVTLGGGVSTFAADEDVEFRLTEPLTNTRTTTTRYAVSAVPDATHITCGASNPVTVDNQYMDWYARVWSAAAAGTIIITTRISGTVAATDVLTVASSAGVNNTHYVEFIQLDGAGEIPSVVDHPVYSAADPTGYGIKAMELSKSSAGIAQLVPNAWMRTWTNAANPPDGYTQVGAGTAVRNSTAAYTRYGGYSWQFNTTAWTGGTYLQSPTFYVTGNTGFCSARMWVYFTTLTSLRSTFTVYSLTATGGALASLGTVSIVPLGTVGGSDPLVDVGTWIELKVEGMPITATTAPYGIVMRFIPETVGAPFGVGYVDVMEAYPFAKCPPDAFEFGDANTLAQAANNQLRTVASPPLYYTFGILDLERAFPTEYARLKLTLGANARAADIEYGIDATVRVLKVERDLMIPSKTTLTLSNRPTLLTTIQNTGAATTSRIISAVNAGTTAAGAKFVSLTAATTLVQGAEISTPVAGVPAVTLPAGTTTTGSAVTYVPANPVTTPQTVVTSGTPPSRVKKILPLY